MTKASGVFVVKMTPQTQDDKSAGSAVGRFSLDKQFRPLRLCGELSRPGLTAETQRTQSRGGEKSKYETSAKRKSSHAISLDCEAQERRKVKPRFVLTC
jgi:hypothetical protein